MLTDTTKQAAQVRLEVLRNLGGSIRLRQALELSEAVRLLAEQGRRDRALPDPAQPQTGAT
jgi:hypothetical protein